MKHEGGAAKAISNAAGPNFDEECKKYIKKYGKLEVGDTMITSAGGSLKCKDVIHTVGPNVKKKNINRIDKEKELLRDCAKNIMRAVKDNDYNSVSIPAISTGIFGFPRELCSVVLASAIKDMIDYEPDEYKNKKIIMCNYDSKTTDTFLAYFFKEFQGEVPSETEESDSETE